MAQAVRIIYVTNSVDTEQLGQYRRNSTNTDATRPIQTQIDQYRLNLPGRVAQSVGHLTHKSGVLGSIPGLATYFRFSFRFFKKGSCQLVAKVCARSTG